jgi:hypothetical protein
MDAKATVRASATKEGTFSADSSDFWICERSSDPY